MIENVRRKLRNIFLTGFLVLLPIIITFSILVFVFNIFEGILTRPVAAILRIIGLPQLIGYHIPGLLGLGLLITLSFLLGLFVTNVIGKKIITIGEKILSKVPLVWNIYYASKQIMESFSMGGRKSLQQVVLVEYPRKGLYTVGFVTSDARGEVQDVTENEVLNIFIPTTPNPTSGMLVMVPREDVILLSMTVEDGIKLVVSGGMVAPHSPYRLKAAAHTDESL
jgi:uncharacterized membrane protein